MRTSALFAFSESYDYMLKISSSLKMAMMKISASFLPIGWTSRNDRGKISMYTGALYSILRGAHVLHFDSVYS